MLLSTLLAFAFAATPPAADDASKSQPSAPAGPVMLATPDDARRVCRAVTPPERLDFEGSEVDRAESALEHGTSRDAALSGRYQVVVPAQAIRFAPYDLEQHTLSLSGSAVPVGAGGGARLALVEDEALPVTAAPQDARRIVQARQQGKLALRVTFVFAEDEQSPCFSIAGAHGSTFAAEPVAWEYLDGERVLARGGEGADRPLVSAAEGARPRVELGKPVDDGGSADVRTTASDHVRELEGCYGDALKRDPYLDGAIVAALDGGGGTERVRIAADSVQDETLAGCVRGVLARVDARGAGRTWLPIHFVLERPERPSEAQQ